MVIKNRGTGKHRVLTMLTPEAQEFRLKAKVAINRSGRFVAPMFAGAVRVTLVLSAPDRRRRDIDNFSKGVLDALTHAGIYDDDSQVDELHVYRRGLEGCVHVTVEELPVQSVNGSLDLEVIRGRKTERDDTPF